jgi:hypothetical protein
MDKHIIDSFTLQDLESLINTPTTYAISLFIPTHVGGRAVRQDHIVLKNQLNYVKKQLLTAGFTEERTNAMLQPAYALVDDQRFWDYQFRTLVVYIGENFFRYFRLPIEYKADVVIDPQFYITPVLPLVIENGTFNILSLSENHVSFYEADRINIKEIKIAGMPDGMNEALWYKNLPKERQFSPGGIAFGHVQWVEKHKKYIVEYLRQVNDSLKPYLNKNNYVLIVAAAETLLPFYKEANTYNRLLNKGIQGNPDAFSIEELHKKAWEVVQPELQKVKHEIIEEYKNLIGSQRFITDIKSIVQAAHDGLIQALFVNKGHHIWGMFDQRSGKISYDTSDSPENVDLLNLATLQTITAKGEAFVLPQQEMPVNAPAAAVLRYNFIPPTQ